MAVWFFAFGESEEFVLDSFRDWATGTYADFYSVNGADRSHFYGSAAEENFVCDVEHFAGDYLLDYRNAQVLADRHDGVARDSG